MIKAIIFDAGGVLLKKVTSYIYREIAKRSGKDYKKVRAEVSKLLRDFESKGIKDESKLWKKIIRKVDGGLSGSELENLWIRIYKKNAKPNNKIFQLAKKLKKGGYKIAILSNSMRLTELCNRKRKVFSEFSPKIFSCSVGVGKPNKKVYKILLEKLRLKPEECVIIDNEKPNLRTARKLGMKAILFKNANQLEKELKKCL